MNAALIDLSSPQPKNTAALADWPARWIHRFDVSS
jgi:hypothetical protein